MRAAEVYGCTVLCVASVMWITSIPLSFSTSAISERWQPPPHRLGTHQRSAFARGQRQQFSQAFGKLGAGQMIGIRLERGIAPRVVERTGLHLAPATKLRKPLVDDAVFRQRLGQRIAGEIRMAASTGKAAHVGDRLDPG